MGVKTFLIPEGERLEMVDPTPHLKNRYGSATELGKGIDVNEQVISLLSRKSIRVFKDKRISRELLETCAYQIKSSAIFNHRRGRPKSKGPSGTMVPKDKNHRERSWAGRFLC